MLYLSPYKIVFYLVVMAAVFLAALVGCEKPRDQERDNSKVKNTEPVKGSASVNGIKMYYEIHGDGKTPLALIHGGGSTIETSFGRIMPGFAAHRKVIAMELQAHGRTSDRNAPESFEQDADDVAALMKSLNIAKADFLGFSNGGNTAMQIALRHPEIVNKLVIISAFYKREGLLPGLFEGLEKASLENMPEPLKAAYVKVAPNKEGLQVMFDKDKERMLNFKDWKDDDLRSIKAPAMLMAADRDVVTPEHTVAMAKLMPNSKLVILPGVHGSFIGEVIANDKNSRMPELTAAMIEEFL
ncbi:MAG TPA: alpha/beta hydrolase, partial [Ignavibacteriales bacterium]|nr:alpha/beta hydrolase [Ignavibacteriales bacterium]